MEIALVLLVIVAVLVFLLWKRKKTSSKELEQLLDNVEDQQVERKAQLIQLLIKDYALNEDEAKESGSYMVEAEKQFLQQFMKQQIEQTTVTGFYESLCELLDQYLYFVPKKSADEVESDESQFVEPVVDKNQEAVEDSLMNSIEESSTKQEEEAEPDWGETFAESGDEMDGDVKGGYEAEQKKE